MGSIGALLGAKAVYLVVDEPWIVERVVGAFDLKRLVDGLANNHTSH